MEEVQIKSHLVSCGLDYTLVLTTNNQIQVAGRLPSGQILHAFEHLVSLDSAVTVKAIESSRFSSIITEQNTKTEFYLWGRTPIGVFSELVSLNKIIKEN